MMQEGLLVEVLNLVPSDYALTITNSIGQILIEKDKNPIDIFLHLDSMKYWANFSKDDKNKEAYIKLIGTDHRRNAYAYKRWLLSQKTKFKNKNDIALYLAKYLLCANVTESPRTKQVSKLITFSNASCINNNNYSYQFASILKSSFNRGEICLAYPSNYMVWVDVDGCAYNHNGLINNNGYKFLFIPESYLTVIDLQLFKHVDAVTGNFRDDDPYVFCTDIVYDYCKDIINKAGIRLNLDEEEN